MGHPEFWGPAGDRLIVVGLTGGIASGKTEVDREFERLGAFVVDADAVARDVVEPGTPTFEAIVREFGKGILGDGGAIDRAALAEIVFADEEKRALLNSLTHPAVFQEMARRVAEYDAGRAGDSVAAVILDAALIVDAGVGGLFDMLIVVTADEESRVRRLVENRGMSEDEARGRIAAQVPETRRIEMASLRIANDGTIEELRERVSEVWREIERRAAAGYP